MQILTWNDWMKRWNDTRISDFEREGLLHKGYKFFFQRSEPYGYNFGPIIHYLRVANMHYHPGDGLGKEVKKMAKTVLAQRFFRIQTPWWEWPHFDCIVYSTSSETIEFETAIFDFLSLVQGFESRNERGTGSNYRYLDASIGTRDSDPSDVLISGFLDVMFDIFRWSIGQYPHQGPRSLSPEAIDKGFQKRILALMFNVAPWKLLQCNLKSQDVLILAERMAVPATNWWINQFGKESFNVDPMIIADSEKRSWLPSKAEVLIILRERINAARRNEAGAMVS